MISDISLIYTSTTGRSGTRYLANIINKNAINATAEHDPYPRGYGLPILWYDKNQTYKLLKLCNMKLERLRRGKKFRIFNRPNKLYIKSVKSGRQLGFYSPKNINVLKSFFPSVETKDIYLESTHAFIKSFGETMYSLIPNMSLIHLTRDPIEVAKSFFNRKSIPGPDNPFLLDVNFERNEIKISKKLTDFQKCLWYWLETEVRHINFLEKHHINKLFEIDIYELNDMKKVAKMFKFLGISYTDIFLDVNRNIGKKPTILTEQDFKEARDLIESIPSWVFDKINDKYFLENRLYRS